jgi:WD40 repeat protein
VADQLRYSIIGEVAKGGFGRILEAEDRTLNRRVAIKELRVANRGQARFEREALITARLQHPSIVPLHELGRWESGEPYYTMRLVTGRPLDDVIAGATTLDERLALLPHVIAVADAIAYAHRQHIIHRDLKPANVLVGEFGETVVIDWGVAKDLSDPSTDGDELDGPYRAPALVARLTQAGEVIGTPVYMAPEQAMGKALDERADVYAIGAILYQLLTGVWPHHGASSSQVIERLVAGSSIPSVNTLQPAVPPDLATIVGTAMQHDRAARYRTAGELAADLRRFQTGQLVAAYHYSRPQLVTRWLRRHRAVVGVAATLLVALGITATASVRSIITERNATRRERDRLILAQATGELERDPTAAVAWLKTYPTSGAEPDLARELALQARARGVARYILSRDPRGSIGSFSPDGSKFAQPGPAGLHVVDLEDGQVATHPHVTNQVRWAPGGMRLIAAPDAAPASIVDLEGGVVTLQRGVRGGWRSPAAAALFSSDGETVVVPTTDHGLMRFSRAGGSGVAEWTPFPFDGYARNGERFASIGPEGVLTWWDARERVAHALPLPPGTTLARDEDTFMFLGDGSALTAATSDGRLCVWSVPDGPFRVLDGDGAPLRQLHASRDGAIAVTLSVDGAVRSWRLDLGTSQRLPDLDGVNDLSIAADGRFAAVALQDRRVLLVDTQTGEQRSLGVHPNPARSLAVSADGRWVASGGDDTSIRLWAVPEQPIVRSAERHGVVASIAVAGDDSAIAAVGERAHLRVGDRSVLLDTRVETVWLAVFSHDAKLLATTGPDGTIQIWDTATARSIAVLDANAGPVFTLAITRDGRSLVSTHTRGDVRIWDLGTGTSRLVDSVPGVKFASLSRDETAIAAGGAGMVQLLALDGSAPRRLDAGDDPIFVTQYSPDGRTLAAASVTGRVFVWDLATGAMRELDRRRDRVYALAFSADSAWLAAGSFAGDVGVWNVATGRGRTLEGHVGEVSALGFWNDSLVTGGSDGTVRVWSLDRGPTRTMVRADGEIHALEVRDRYVYAAGSSGAVYRWPLAAFGDPPPEPPRSLAPFLNALTTVSLDRTTGRAITTARTELPPR